MRSTTQRGDEFRDLIGRLFNAAGFEVTAEVRVGAKKADLRSIWTRHEFEGPISYLIEAKDYEGTLPLDECSKFVAEYGTAVRDKLADRAYLVSKGAISADGRDLIDRNRVNNLFCFTFSEFQRNIMRIDNVLSDQMRRYEQEGIRNYYIPPRTTGGEDLESLITQWMNSIEAAPPIAIIGGYGTGKSTFAKYLAAKLSAQALKDATCRVPILVPLGEIVDEQSIEGLISKNLASHHRAVNYHFGLFSELNACGRFVIIFDGFDEMKYGMTPSIFERNFSELLRLDRGQSRILLLGRDTAFHSDIEFRMIIEGRRVTAAGTQIQMRNRRACRPIIIEGFNLADAKTFVSRYFTFKIKERELRPTDDKTLTALLGEGFEDLLLRPVHAQMLCEIATERPLDFLTMDEFELYDRFIFYLIDRESAKQGRSQIFSVETRRAVNALVAWWLWENGGASTTSLDSIPHDFFLSAIKGIYHEFDEAGLRRELTIGCLIEKAANVVYFPHRSIQEFLVSEHMYENFTEMSEDTNRVNVIRLMNSEIADFINARLIRDEKKYINAEKWLDGLSNCCNAAFPDGFTPFLASLGRYSGIAQRPLTSALHLWCYLLSSSPSGHVRQYEDELWMRIIECARDADRHPVREQINLAFAVIWAFTLRGKFDPQATAKIICQLSDFRYLAIRIETTHEEFDKKRARVSPFSFKKEVVGKVISSISRDDNVRSWIFLSCYRVINNDKDLEIDIDKFIECSKDAVIAPSEVVLVVKGKSRRRLVCPIEALYEELKDAKVVATMKAFFSSAELREAMVALRVERA